MLSYVGRPPVPKEAAACQAGGCVPGGVVVRVPEACAAGSRGRHGGWGGELAEAQAGCLTGVCTLAACELGAELGRSALLLNGNGSLLEQPASDQGFSYFGYQKLVSKAELVGGGRRRELGETEACDPSHGP
eukprot:CAMPEP_0201865566 /NCGR_PEP_ID=MMETSP0902-20130614/409_1 /ASSEMBLY_ACC=CAM_ASM_000551 /TAXON_ID=420261 /ORGANISM="Thalassiosira antarctica, Strain CCMP982" /LENGTH=131 /DNA_ID=CAMNT_0048390347 /DNA_START=510 /DNA_END=907 /DNA_ORIENTATION=+